MSDADTATALVYAAPGRADLRDVALHIHEPILNGESRAPHIVVRTEWSGLSRGTERLVFHGQVPESEWQRMRCPFQDGAFPFPVKYGYSAVGTVTDGDEALVGRHVFALFPHQDRFALPAGMVVPLPDGLPARRATLAANLETALNVVWDAHAGPGDRIAIVGGGIVGLLTAGLAAAIAGTQVTVIDITNERAAIAHQLGADFALPDAAGGDYDIVVHSSATEAGLETALSVAGFEARIIEASWYGARPVTVPLGGRFHSQRLRLISSQVGHLPEARRARWTHRRRLETALSLLQDPRYDALITEEVAFRDLPEALPRLLAPGAPGLATAIRYD